MFTSNSKPFQICYYKKNIKSDENKVLLLTSFPCVHFPNVKFVGSLFDSGLFLLGKNQRGNCFVYDNKEYPIKDNGMSTAQFIEDFKNSDGLDFIIISTPCHFLLTRSKDRKIKIFMTTSANYIETFSNVEGLFGTYKEEITETKMYYSKEGETLINVENSENPAIVRIGSLRDEVLHFDQYYLNKSTIREFQEILDSFYDKKCDYVEVLARCKIAGMRKGDDFVWFVQVAEDCLEAEYIVELTKIFKPFVIKE